MSKTRSKTRTLTAITAVLGALVLTAASVAPAHAVTITSASPTSGLAKSATVTVKLSFTGTEAFYALAQCNDGLADGRACNSASAIGLLDATKFPSGGEGVKVNHSFTNSSLIPGMPPIAGTTTCSSQGSDACAIFATTYDKDGKAVGTDQVSITFAP